MKKRKRPFRETFGIMAHPITRLLPGYAIGYTAQEPRGCGIFALYFEIPNGRQRRCTRPAT